MPSPVLPLPRSWPARIQAAILHSLALAHQVLTASRSAAAADPTSSVRLAAEVERLLEEVELLKGEMAIKDARFSRMPPARRPQYTPVERFKILCFRASRCWSTDDLALRFLVTVATIGSWTKRLDEGGEDAVLATPVPVNKYPDHVKLLVDALRAASPAMGAKRIAQSLARAGVHLAISAVRRWKPEAKPEPVPQS